MLAALPALALATVDARSAIVGPSPASTRVRHALDAVRLRGLVGLRSSDADARRVLEPVLQRLVGGRWAAFAAGLTEAEALAWIGDVLIGEGARPGTLGQDASFFALSPHGRAFAALKGGVHGQSIELFGDPATLTTWDAKHRYLEFANLDE